MAGNTESKPAKEEEEVVEQENGGVHIFEFHFPSWGIGIAGGIVLVVVIGGCYLLWRFYCQ